MAPSVLLVGAGGALGRPLVQEFIKQKSRFDRIAILATDSSKKAKFADAADAGIEIVVGGILKADSYKGFDTVISLVGNPLLRLQPAMIDLAYEAGVRHFYPSEFGIDLSQEVAFLFRYFRSKQDTRSHLIAKSKAHPDFKYTLLMNGGFSEWATFGLDEDTKTLRHYGKSDAQWDVTSIPDVCRYTVDSIFLPHENGRREIKVRGEIASPQKIANAIAKARGIEVQLEAMDSSIPLQKSLEGFKNDDEDSEYYWSIMWMLGSGFARLTGELSNDQFDFKPETLQEGLDRYYSSSS